MMSKVPFSVYDFFAYLSSGVLLVAAVDFLWGPQWLVEDPIVIQKAVFLIFLSYIVGHIVGHLSSIFLEKLLAQGFLGRPSEILMKEKESKLRRMLFPGYFTALPQEVRERINERKMKYGFGGKSESFFLHAFSIVTKDIRVRDRLDQFRNLYGFARNMTMALFSVAIFLFVDMRFMEGSVVKSSWILISLVLGVGMLYRYLKFYWQYSYQLFVVYSEEQSEAEK